MSIIFNVAPATRKEDTYNIVMAAGSDPESNEEPVATGDANSYQQPVTALTTTTNSHQHHNHYHHNHHHHSHHHHNHYLGLPYQDHNYGAPPPPTPPQSPPLPKINGFIEESSNISNQSATETADENEENSITRCICGFDHDDGYMICCDKCSVWQHVECMGIDKTNIPERYFCDECQPRTVDKDKAVTLQSKKKEEMTDTSATDSGDEVTTTTYTAVSNSPTSLTLTTLKSKKLKKKRRRKEKGDEREDRFEKKKLKSKLENGGMANINEYTFVDVNEDTMDPWDNSANSLENYQEAERNQYSADIQHLLAVHNENSSEALTLSSSQLPVQLAIAQPVNATSKGVYMIEPVKAKQPVIEYRGKVVLKEQFDVQEPFFKRPYPCVLFYNIGNVRICVDARTYGTYSRFVRRSCKPTAEVKHAVIDGSVHLYLCAIHDITKGTELTIAFDYNYKECGYLVDCACLQKSCPVVEHNNKCFQENSQESEKSTNPHKNNHILRGEEDLSSSTNAAGSATCKNRKVSPLRVSISNHSNQTSQSNPEPVESSQAVDNQQPENEATKEQKMPEPEKEQEEQDQEKLKKMTREERKMHAIMEAFKKMERTQKRRQQALERIANAKAAKAEQGTPEGSKEDGQELEQNGTTEGESQPVLPVTHPPKPRAKCRNSRKRSAKRRRVNSTASSNAEPSSPEVTVCTTPVTSAAITSFSDNSNSGLTSPVPSTKSFRFPKTKKFLINEWLNDKAQEASANKPLTIKTEAVDLQVTTATSCPATPVLRTAVTNALEKSFDAGAGAKIMGSAKKRWLRQAMSETSTTTTSKAGSGEHLSPVCNGAISPTANSPAISPSGSSVNDFMTPLKKRRLRASISEESVTTVTVTTTAAPQAQLQPPPPASTPPPPLVSSSQVDSMLRTPSPRSKVSLEESSKNGYKPMLSPITPVTPVTDICRYEELAKQISADSGFSGTPTDCKLSPVTPSVCTGQSFDSVDSSKSEILTETSAGDRNCTNVNSHMEVSVAYETVVSQPSLIVESHVSTSTDHIHKHFQSEPIVLDSSKRDVAAPVESGSNFSEANRTSEAGRESKVSLQTDIRTSVSVSHVQNLITGARLSSSSENDLQQCLQNSADGSAKCGLDANQVKTEVKLPQSNSPRSDWQTFDQNKGSFNVSSRTREPRYMDVFSSAYRSRRNSGPADNRTHYGMRPYHNPFADDNVKYESGLYTSFTSPRKLFLPSGPRNTFTAGPSKGQVTAATTTTAMKSGPSDTPAISSTTEPAPTQAENKADIQDSDMLVTNSCIDSKPVCVSNASASVSTSSPVLNSQSVASSTNSESVTSILSSSSSSASTSPPPMVSSTTVTTVASSVSTSLPSTSLPSAGSATVSSAPTTPVKRKVTLLEYRKRRKEKSQVQPSSSTSSSPTSRPTTPTSVTTTSGKSFSENPPNKSLPSPLPTLAPLPLFNPTNPLEETVNGKASTVLPIKKMKSPLKSPLISSLLLKPKEKRDELEAQWKASEKSKEDPLDKVRRDLDSNIRERERRDSGGIRSKEEHVQSPMKRPGSPLPPPPPPSKVKRPHMGLKLHMPPPPPPRNGPDRMQGDIVVDSMVTSNSKQQPMRSAHFQQPPPPPPQQPVQKEVSGQPQQFQQQPYQQQTYQYPQQYPQLQQQPPPPPQQQPAQQQYPQQQQQQQQQYNYNGFGQGYGDQKLQPQTQQHFAAPPQQYQQQAAYQQPFPPPQQPPQYQHQQQPQRPPTQQPQPAAAPAQHPYQQPQQQPQQQQYAGYGQQHYNTYSRSNGFYQQ
ncbi:inactive histone-lysine N-methyltransferase 2E-like isoform X2 [Ptychodera flava]|uniref:inactive histone-lysine N-methyltransferase 2E-like isoform X2 n=1 Tax=Ptychodera flava TaxID=63121 RepID=UPI003969D413